MRTRTSRNHALFATVLLIAGCAVGAAEGPTDQEPVGASARPGTAGRPNATGGTANVGSAGKGMGGTVGPVFGGAPGAVAGSSSTGQPGVGGASGGSGPGPFGGGGKASGMGGTPPFSMAGRGGTSSGGAAAGGRGGGPPSSMGGRAGSGSVTGGAGTTSLPPSNCSEGNKTVSNNGTGKHCGYTYEYWKDSGNGTLTLKPDGFSVDWSGVNDLLGRKGIRPGSASLVVNYQADYQPSGNSYLCIYGWTRNPLVEYYIVDSWGNWRPPGGQGHVGTVTSDDGTYDIYKIGKSGPNIDGNGSFTQYWSVRTAKKTSGVITVGNHFTAWKNAGMPMGNFYEVSMTVEGYQSSGKADVKFSIQ